MTVAIYIRVSTEEQVREGFSISAQREKLKAYCQVHDWTEYKFYVDEGISAKDTNRPQLKQMIEHIEQGLIDTVLVYRLDRLTRSVVDLYKLLDIFEKNNCTFKSATEVYDTGSAIGRLFITLVAAMAQWERENLGERVRMGQIEKARQGQFSAPAPFGYKKVGDKLEILEDQKEILLDIIDKVKSGHSIRKIADDLNSSSLIPKRGYQWHIASILVFLKNPAIYGALRWKDEIIEGTHEGIITKEEFEKLQKILHDRQNFKKRETYSIFVFQMKLICPNCGNRLTSERSKYYRKTDKKHVESNHYRCQACVLNKRKAIGISEKKIEVALLEYMENVQFIRKANFENKEAIDNEYDLLLDKLSKIEKQREKYQKAWSVDLMTDDEFSKRMNETKVFYEETKTKLNNIQPQNDLSLDTERMKEVIKEFNFNWRKLLPEEKKQFMSTFVESIEITKKDRDVTVRRVNFY